MRKYITSILVFTLIFLVGCNSDKSEKSNKESNKVSDKGSVSSEIVSADNETENSEEDTTTDASEIYPDEADMAKDIDDLGKNEINFPNDSCILETKSIEIEKASKNEKSFNVYCYAIQENEEFTAKNYYNLIYNYYEIGGWKLDECLLEKIDMKPKKICSQELACVAINNKYYVTSCEYVSAEQVNDYEFIYRFKGITEYNYMDQLYDLVVYCNFSNETGWSCYADYTNIDYDWSKIYGTWYGETDEYTVKINIKSIDSFKNEIKFYIEVGNYDNSVKPAEKSIIYSYTTDYGMDEFNAKYCAETEMENIGWHFCTNCDLYFDENYGLKQIKYNVERIKMSKVD